MRGPDSSGERSFALFLLGLVAFSPPLISVFSVARAWLGVPSLYLYVFGAWMGLILLLGLSAAHRPGAGRGRDAPPAAHGPDAAPGTAADEG